MGAMSKNSGRRILQETNSVLSERLLQFPISDLSNADLQGVSQEQSGGVVLNDVLFKLGVEPSLTVREAAAFLRWSYWRARRYFRQVDGICVCYQPKRYKRAYRTFTIPVSIFAREWQKMTGQNPESTQLIHQRLLTLVR